MVGGCWYGATGATTEDVVRGGGGGGIDGGLSKEDSCKVGVVGRDDDLGTDVCLSVGKAGCGGSVRGEIGSVLDVGR